MRSFWFLLLLALIPAVHAVGLLVPTEFDSLVKVYTSNTTEINVSVKGDSSNNTVMFFANSPDSKLLINGVQRFSTTFSLAPNQIRKTTLQLTGTNNTGMIDVTYGFTIGNGSSSSGIGFQQVTEDKFRVRVFCVGSCTSSNPPVNSHPGPTSGSGGAVPARNSSLNTSSTGPVKPIQPVNGAPMQDVAGDGLGVDTAVRPTNDAIPSISASGEAVQQIGPIGLIAKAGRGTALVLVGMLISVFVLEVAVYSVVKRMSD